MVAVCMPARANGMLARATDISPPRAGRGRASLASYDPSSPSSKKPPLFQRTPPLAPCSSLAHAPQLESLDLTDEEKSERDKLLADGFGDWTRKDFKAFVGAIERNGRQDIAAIAREARRRSARCAGAGVTSLLRGRESGRPTTRARERRRARTEDLGSRGALFHRRCFGTRALDLIERFGFSLCCLVLVATARRATARRLTPRLARRLSVVLLSRGGGSVVAGRPRDGQAGRGRAAVRRPLVLFLPPVQCTHGVT